MRFKKAVLALAAAATLAGCSRQPVMHLEEGVEVPDFRLKSVAGRSVSLSEYKGRKPVLLVFWATWCQFCMEEMPDVTAMQRQYGDKLAILAINIQETEPQVAAFVRSHGMQDLEVLLDTNGDVMSSYGIVGVPTLVLINKEGKGIVAENGLTEKLREAVREAVREPAPEPEASRAAS